MVIGAGFAMLGLFACAQPWLREGAWTWALCWPGIAFAVAGVAYMFDVRGVFGKREDGRLGALHVAALFPFLAFTWGAWHVLRVVTREPMIHSLSPTLRIGRRLLASELPADVDHIVDLTAEFRELARGRSYLSLRILDAGVPDRDELGRVLDAVPRTGTTFVHCAQGHGRTALFTACLLIAREQLDADAAISRVLAARPRARMHRSQRAFVHAFAARNGRAPESPRDRVARW